MTPLVSVCIVHYGSNEYLRKCIESITKSSAAASDMEIIIIDNNEQGDARPAVHEMPFGDSQKTYIQNRKNVGFAEGCNQGIRAAEGRYVFILNNDIEIDRDCIRYLTEFAEAHPDVAVLQPKMLDHAERDVFHSSAAGGFIDMLGYPFARGRIFDIVEKDNGQYDDIVEIFWASGAALFARKDILEISGLFDPDFFLYMEEIDLQWRIQLLGQKIVYIPEAKIYHIGCPHLGRKNFSRMYYTHRNSMLMMMKNLSLPNLIFLFPVRLAFEAATAVCSFMALRVNRGLAILKSFAYILRHLRGIAAKRRQVQSLRKVSDSAVFANACHGSIVVRHFFRQTKRVTDMKDFRVKQYRPGRGET
ncbi:MAG: glycosyltransferase family 2 protein [Nitrospirota bacterium]